MKDSIKLEAIAVIGVLAGVFYLWGWIYFANYYNYYGLPYSFAGNFHAQTLMIAGATEFTDMIEKFMGWLIGIFFLLVILHYTIPPGLKQKISVLYAAIPYRNFLYFILFMALYVVFFKTSRDYVRNDALEDSKKQEEFMTSCTYKIIPKTEQLKSYQGLDSLKLVDDVDGKFYFYKESDQKHMLIIPETEVSVLIVTGTKH